MFFSALPTHSRTYARIRVCFFVRGACAPEQSATQRRHVLGFKKIMIMIISIILIIHTCSCCARRRFTTHRRIYASTCVFCLRCRPHATLKTLRDPPANVRKHLCVFVSALSASLEAHLRLALKLQHCVKQHIDNTAPAPRTLHSLLSEAAGLCGHCHCQAFVLLGCCRSTRELVLLHFWLSVLSPK